MTSVAAERYALWFARLQRFTSQRPNLSFHDAQKTDRALECWCEQLYAMGESPWAGRQTIYGTAIHLDLPGSAFPRARAAR